MISVSSALKNLLKLTKRQRSESVLIEHCYDRILAKDLVASYNQPPFRSSAMDGYAINLNDKIVGRILKVVGESAAGQSFDLIVRSEEAVRIFTGAPLPDGTNCIVIQEDVSVKNNHIILKDGMEQSHFVREKGSDFSSGYTIDAPVRIKPTIVSLIAAMNFDTVEVYRKPKVAIIATGSELVIPGKKIPPNKIVSSNSYGIAAMLTSYGASPQIFTIANDNIEEICKSLKLTTNFDLILTIGGASVGDYDLIRRSAEDQRIKLAFHGVAMKPGKPLLAGTINNKLLIGLPGNPVSALLCCQVMVKPVIEKMLGLKLDNTNLKISAKLGTNLNKNGEREHFLRSVLIEKNGNYIVFPVPRQDSSLITELSKSNSLIRRPPFAPAIDAGQIIEIHSFFTEFD